MPRTFRVICVSVAIFISIVPTFCQSESNPPNSQIGAGANETGVPNPNLLQSELSSALIPPCVLVGTSSFFPSTAGDSTIWVDITTKPPTLHGTTTVPVTSVISWGSGSCTTATTCTIVFQNAPPGPAVVSLKGTTTTTWVDVVASTVVVYKTPTPEPSPAPAPTSSWFPATSPNSQFTTVQLAAINQWWSPGGSKGTETDTYANPYSTLQWDPGPVTIIYQ